MTYLKHLKQVKKTAGGLESMTLEQRKKIFKLYPTPPGQGDLDRALQEVLETAPPDQRAVLAEQIKFWDDLENAPSRSGGPGRF